MICSSAVTETFSEANEHFMPPCCDCGFYSSTKLNFGTDDFHCPHEQVRPTCFSERLTFHLLAMDHIVM